MVFIALPWLALEITGSAAMAGAVVALTAIPGLFLSPILGTIVDRIGRKVSAIISEGLSAVAILLIPAIISMPDTLQAKLDNVNTFNVNTDISTNVFFFLGSIFIPFADTPQKVYISKGKYCI